MVISQDYVDVPVGERAMRTFVAAPRAPGRHPGVVFYSDIFQLTASTLRFCAR
ncbi:MAG: carboxymethylenebutenolidase, partial [Solirubrobacteraceae bacterium]|nr:carboxymethylenebutenolidase [Solirubrobacteraceae bacterium]